MERERGWVRDQQMDLGSRLESITLHTDLHPSPPWQVDAEREGVEE